MPNLKPFRDYNEHDVLSIYAFTGSVPVSKGTLVTAVQTWKNVDGPFNLSGNYLKNISPVAGAISARFDLLGLVYANEQLPNDLTKPVPIGITLKDVRDVDENGERLIFNPRKLAEMDAVLPNHAVPILTRGLVYINDIDTGNYAGTEDNNGGLPDVGDAAYAGANGQISTDGVIPVGKFLSTVGADGYALVKINL
jgi:hypothetical protein